MTSRIDEHTSVVYQIVVNDVKKMSLLFNKMSLFVEDTHYTLLTFDSLTGSWSVWPHVVTPQWLIKKNIFFQYI